MATLARWDPFRELVNLQNEMTRLFSRTASSEADDWTSGAWAPPLDIQEGPEHFTIFCELPGTKPDQVDVTISDGVLTIRGERKFYEGVSEDSFHRIERRYGTFARSLTLPSAVSAERITATFDGGVLRVEIPKAEDAKPRRIEVKATS